MVGTMVASGCSLEMSDEAGLDTETAANPLIYGNDDRIEYYQGSSAQQGAADAVFVVVDDSELSCSAGTCTLLTVPYDDWFEEGLCDDEPFRDQPTIGFCSAFLVGSDRIATAGHCLTGASCTHTSFVPWFRIDSAGGSAPTTIPEAEVLHCGAKVASKAGSTNDYAVYTLTAPAAGLTPLCIRRSDKVAVGTDLVIIGHPYTLPQKIAGGAQAQAIEKNFFTANLDDYGGNSGSPVFDVETMVVQGILVRGNEDFVFDSEAYCWRSNVCPDSGCPGFEEVSHAKKIAKFVPNVPCYVPALCEFDADCDDGDVCNGAEVCGTGGCQPGTPLVCDDGDPCNGAETCGAAGCGPGTPLVCDDGDPCNGVETCGTGGCQPGTPLVCDDGDPCTQDACDPVAGCYQTVLNCDDGDLCNGAETCGAGGCEPGIPLVCNDGDPCTQDACDPVAGCYQTVLNCDDGDLCNGAETCGAGGCEPGIPVVCEDDGDPCNDELCDSGTGGCISVDNGTCAEPDVVTVSLAKYAKSKSKLEVRATSSAQPDVSLSVHYTASGSHLTYDMTYNAGKNRYELKTQPVPRPDGDVLTVVSTGGGSAVKAVQIK